MGSLVHSRNTLENHILCWWGPQGPATTLLIKGREGGHMRHFFRRGVGAETQTFAASTGHAFFLGMKEYSPIFEPFFCQFYRMYITP